MIPLITILAGISGTALAKPIAAADPSDTLFFDNTAKWFAGDETSKGDAAKLYPELNAVDNLPKVSIEGVVAMAIKTVLKWAFYLTIISLVVASIYYIMSLGKEEDITKARGVILYLIIGMAIIAGAYGIISGVARFNFFSVDISKTGGDKIQQAEK